MDNKTLLYLAQIGVENEIDEINELIYLSKSYKLNKTHISELEAERQIFRNYQAEIERALSYD